MLPDGPQSLYATPTGTFTERRRHRLQLVPCATCGHEAALHVKLRTTYILYVQCRQCMGLWTVAKPGRQSFGT
jgi:hypothetical protein